MLFSTKLISQEKKDPNLKTINQSTAIVEFSPEGIIISANENFLNTTGYTLEEIKNNHHSMFCFSDYAQSPEYALFWEQLGTGQFFKDRFQRVHRNGHIIWLEATYNPVIVKGKVIKIIKFATDITEQMKRDNENESILNAIHKSMAVIEFDTQGNILYANENFLNTTGYRLEEIIGKHHKIFCETEYVRSQQYRYFWEDLAKGNYYSGQFKRVNKQRQPIWLEASYNPIVDENNQVFKIIKFAQNITSNVLKNQADEKNAVLAHQIASDTEAYSEKGAEVIRAAAQEMNTIAQMIIESSNNMHELERQVKKISQITEDIKSITQQTNLLALNAAVEAARAGEQGRGFSVVASEVRKLAEHTKKSSDTISQNIVQIDEKTQSTLNQMSLCQDKVSNGVTLANLAGEAITEILNQNQQIVDVVNRFSAVQK